MLCQIYYLFIFTWNTFAQWGKTYHLNLIISHSNIDRFLSLFIHDLANANAPRSLAQMAAAACAFLFIPPKTLHYTHKALTGWNRKAPSQQYATITWNIALFFAMTITS